MSLEWEFGRDLKGSEISRILVGRAWKTFRDNLGAMPRLYLLKTWRFWSGYELPQIEAYVWWRRVFTGLKLLPVPFTLLSALGLVGLAFLPSRPRRVRGDPGDDLLPVPAALLPHLALPAAHRARCWPRPRPWRCAPWSATRCRWRRPAARKGPRLVARRRGRRARAAAVARLDGPALGQRRLAGEAARGVAGRPAGRPPHRPWRGAGRPRRRGRAWPRPRSCWPATWRT